MNRTKIPWATHTWNPITGCSPVSEGCEHCYAAAMSRRFGLPWGSATFHPERLTQPAALHKPALVFVCSMADLWHPTVNADDRWAVFTAMWAAPQHTYILLTKRPGAIDRQQQYPANWWVGVTCENQARADQRWPAIAGMDIRVRFVSVEPMLGPVSFSRWQSNVRPDWVIAGPETGPGARSCNGAWIDILAAESPCFFDKRPWSGRRREWPRIGRAEW